MAGVDVLGEVPLTGDLSVQILFFKDLGWNLVPFGDVFGSHFGGI